MKIRNGFVSNSSSSSFIALAFDVKNVESPFEKIADMLGEKKDFDKKVQEYLSRDYYSEDDMDEIHREVYWELDIERSKGVRLLQGSEDGVGKDEKVLAIMVAETDSYGGGDFSDGEIVLDDSNSDYIMAKELRDVINPEASIKIKYGTRCC